MLRRMSLDRGSVLSQDNVYRVELRLDYNDLEARELVKERGYKWDTVAKVWRSEVLEVDQLPAEFQSWLDLGFAFYGQTPDEISSLLNLLEWIGEPKPVAMPVITVAYGPIDRKGYSYEPTEVVDRIQLGFVTRKIFRNRRDRV